jgi:LPXTG-motif cell wall-anchored protein
MTLAEFLFTNTQWLIIGVLLVIVIVLLILKKKQQT